MLEDVDRHFSFPAFTASMPVTLRDILDNDTTTRDKTPPQSIRGDKS